MTMFDVTTKTPSMTLPPSYEEACGGVVRGGGGREETGERAGFADATVDISQATFAAAGNSRQQFVNVENIGDEYCNAFTVESRTHDGEGRTAVGGWRNQDRESRVAINREDEEEDGVVYDERRTIGQTDGRMAGIFSIAMRDDERPGSSNNDRNVAEKPPPYESLFL